MKKFSRFVAFLVLAVSFTTPLIASADSACQFLAQGRNCTVPTTGASGICDASLTCQPNMSVGSGGSSGGVNPSILQGYATSIIGIINSILVPVLMAVAFITFLFGVYKYFILGADSDTERATGRQFVLWGVIGFVVILSLWALVNIVMGTLNLSAGTRPRIPEL